MDLIQSIHESVDAIRHELRRWEEAVPDWSFVRESLSGIAEAAREASNPEAASFAQLLEDLTRPAESLRETQSARDELQSLMAYFDRGLAALAESLPGEAGPCHALVELRQQAVQRWPDCLSTEPADSAIQDSDDTWSSETSRRGVTETPPDTSLPTDVGQIGLILQSLIGGASPVAEAREESPVDSAADRLRRASERSAPVRALVDEPPLDPEIVEAYLDDGQRCLSEIEGCLLAFEGDPQNRQPLAQVCRELHTLKGASASVGLHRLAHYLHEVEDQLQEACDGHQAIDVQAILNAVDAVRVQMNRCGQPAANQEAPAVTIAAPVAVASVLPSNDVPSAPPSRTANEPVGTSSERFIDSGGSSQDSVRVKSAQLDRLMDMLAELVMLRNRRESRVDALRSVHSEIVRCVSRLRAYDEASAARAVVYAGGAETEPRARTGRQHVSSLTEIANDLLELGSSLRELYEPVSEENLSISRFIRQFRQELIQLRRVPIAGLFQRLQRSARDAARSESKQVRLQLIGEDVGLETSLQQQLYEPLLHIVRNAVSHGVEPEAVRKAHGKAPVGTVTLEAHGSANLLVITVRDDGSGLDYDALRRRGLERGLISPERAANRSELARLIFHPGFSTRTETSEISGRGVGMDVVATAVERMHGWIEVDSMPGQGTTVRLLIPLHSVIEHVMVFRAGGQEFGIPTQFVELAGSRDSIELPDVPLLALSDLFPRLSGAAADETQVLLISRRAPSVDSTHDVMDAAPVTDRLGILVDEIVGPEEVVVRSLPGLLQLQKLFSGVTLSGTGDVMMLFDSQQLLELGRNIASPTSHSPAVTKTPARPLRRALVVDDSRSSRRLLIQNLERQGYRCEEAANGLDAWRMVKDQAFDVVFTDLEMPEMGGLDLLREMKTDSTTADLPVIIVSSRSEDVFRQKAKQLGVHDYLIKPISEPTLRPALESLANVSPRNPA